MKALEVPINHTLQSFNSLSHLYESLKVVGDFVKLFVFTIVLQREIGHYNGRTSSNHMIAINGEWR